MLDQEIRQAWAKALRSGEYQPGKGALLYHMPSGECFRCGLGVLCEVLIELRPELGIEGQQHGFTYSYGGDTGLSMGFVIHSEIREAIGLSMALHDRVISMSEGGMPFEEIAHWLANGGDVRADRATREIEDWT